ncbi:hypothetical protein Sango_1885700 [Sesamum angolense]|uniref:Uncharacterized protein n=1 Tax=Sesamum angolense TaxID=2727404 RepID=A0AAE1WIV7_9LAMI|nr:hypothetical protein Sango_1885700 [Sesamum angolense]
MSIEALAMAGVNWMEIGITLEKLELGFFYDPPSYLSTVAEEIIDQNVSCRVKYDDADHDSVLQNEEMIKEKIKEWAKAVASLEPMNL